MFLMKVFKKIGVICAVFAAILFGASTPAAKFLLGQIDPWLLAGILYLGSGVGIIIILLLQYFFKQHDTKDTAFSKYDWLWLGSATLFGGIIGPVMLMSALVGAGAASVSLLLILESVFTAIIAWTVFREHTDKKLIFGVVLIIAGSFVLSFNFASPVNLKAALLVIGACFAWAIDNNLTRNISAANPLKIVAIKSTVAGITNTTLALMMGAVLPTDFYVIAISSVVGFLGYGFSLILFVLALRHIGTARTSSYFSLAPFVGACCAIIFLGEPLSWQLILAGTLMGAGLWLHITEQHEHWHEHESLIHDHTHIHDEHHQHEHKTTDPTDAPHSHLHEHAPLLHSHFHYPDIHHRHKHKK
jgi:drug/metabolite transporter (DMT)-like permease